MPIIRQESLFSINELYAMEPTQRYDAIISVIDIDYIYREVSKKSRPGALEELNYSAMIISVFIRYVQRIPIIKDLVKHLNEDIAFKINCGLYLKEKIKGSVVKWNA